jgi:chaperonin GroES
VASVNIKPLEDKILVQANEAETTTASGLVIPDTAKEKPQEGTVVAVGPGRWDEDGEKRIPLDVSEGDVVIYSKYGGTEIKYNGEEYLILSAATCWQSSTSKRLVFRPGVPVTRVMSGRRHASLGKKLMSKQIEFNETCRRAMEAGVDKLADAVR